MYIKNTLTTLWITTIIYNTAADGCTWCEDPVSTCLKITDRNGWTLARAVGPKYKKWFPYTDALQGKDAATDDGSGLYNIGDFQANLAGFNQFLFTSGDCSAWLIASKDQVIGEHYTYDKKRTMCSSSESNSPTQAVWLNRPKNKEDPWISTVDHRAAINSGKMLYGEASVPHQYGHTSNVVKSGVYVYFRKAEGLDKNGCGSVPSTDCGVLDIDGFLGDCSNEFKALNNKDEAVSKRIDGVDTRIDGVDTRIDGIDKDIESIKETIKKLKGGYSPGIGDWVFSTENKDMMILFMFAVNLLLVIGGCIGCFLWTKSKKEYSKYDAVKMYDSENAYERQKLQK